MNRRRFLGSVLGLGAAAIAAPIMPKATGQIEPGSLSALEDTYLGDEKLKVFSKVADDIRKIFAVLDPVGGWPGGSEDWTEEEQDAYYGEHNVLNVNPPSLTQEEIERRMAEMEKVNATIMEWLGAL